MAQVSEQILTVAQMRGAEEALIAGLQATTQELPMNQVVDVVREDGAWKLCSRLTLLE